MKRISLAPPNLHIVILNYIIDPSDVPLNIHIETKTTFTKERIYDDVA